MKSLQYILPSAPVPICGPVPGLLSSPARCNDSPSLWKFREGGPSTCNVPIANCGRPPVSSITIGMMAWCSASASRALSNAKPYTKRLLSFGSCPKPCGRAYQAEGSAPTSLSKSRNNAPWSLRSGAQEAGIGSECHCSAEQPAYWVE